MFDLARFADLTHTNLPALMELEGQLTAREIRFLMLLAAYPTAPGVVLEIGSFKGKSTSVLAKGAQFAGDGRVVAVDPLTSPAKTDPSLGTAASGLDDFRRNLEKMRVTELVEFHQSFSTELAKGWSRPLRLLWIDGDHTYRGTKTDFDLFAPFLADGGIVAFHDVMHPFDGPIRVFVEDVLGQRQFGPTGVCGSIGWAQFNQQGTATPQHSLRDRLKRLIPYSKNARPDGVFARWLYKLHRARVEHGEVDPAQWCRMVAQRTS